MKKEEINFGIGFITGRPNVCKIINSYYKYIIEQTNELDEKVKLTFFILYDLNYLNSKKEDFYNIDPEVHKHIKIKYIHSEYIIKQKDEIKDKYNLTEEDVNLFLGQGYAKSRNSILYEAMKDRIDYLLFWDDDEYPLAAINNGGNIKWLKQKNVLQHIKYIANTDITYGYRCGMINPLPYIEYNDTVTEEIYKQFINAIENEVCSWKKVQEMIKENSVVNYADEEIATYQKDVEEVKNIGKDNFVLGSEICLNLRHIEKIPAFYNPADARGEDTFFSMAMANLKTKVLKIPVYHFHDAYLKFTFLMEDKFPKKLKKIKTDDDGITLRFTRTTTGWVKYKPLFYYILNKDKYENIIIDAKKNLEDSAEKVSTLFKNCNLSNLPNILEEYNKHVTEHYEEYLKTNRIWNKIKEEYKLRREK